MSSGFETGSDRRWAKIPWLADGLDWLTTHERQVLGIGVAFQLAVLLVMIAPPLTTLYTGDVVLLRVVPIDPRDMFRGDYVNLGYEFSRPTSDGSPSSSMTWSRLGELQGKTIYVLLMPEEDGKHWRSNGYQLEPPTKGKFIRGTVMANAIVEFGIEKYFVQEGEGQDYEQAVRDHKLAAEVLVDGSGRAQLKRLVIE